MKIVLMSKDRELFRERGQGYRDLAEQARDADEVHVIVHTLKTEGFAFKKTKENIFLYPTNSYLTLNSTIPGLPCRASGTMFEWL